MNYTTIYGDIRVLLTRKIFDWELSKELNLGDLVIFPDSSSYIPGVEPNVYSIGGTTRFYTGIKLDGGIASLYVEAPNLDSVRVFHTALLKSELVQSEVISLTMAVLTLVSGTAEGLSVFFYAAVGGVLGAFGVLLGLIGAFFVVRKLAKKWSEELGEEKVKLTCLSFLTFLVLLAILITAISRF